MILKMKDGLQVENLTVYDVLLEKRGILSKLSQELVMNLQLYKIKMDLIDFIKNQKMGLYIFLQMYIM